MANEYVEKIVQALNANDRELLVSLFPEYARSKIDNFDEKIDNIFRGYNNNKFSGKIIRYKLNEDNDYESSSDKGKLQKKVYGERIDQLLSLQNAFKRFPWRRNF